MNLKFDEEPMYAALIALFEPLLGGFGSSVARPLQVENAVRVSARVGGGGICGAGVGVYGRAGQWVVGWCVRAHMCV